MSEGTEKAARMMAGGEHDEAERLLLGLLQERPEDGRANYLMASLCDQRGRERRAVPFYRRALARPDEPSPRRTSRAPTWASAAPTGCWASTRTPVGRCGRARSASRQTGPLARSLLSPSINIGEHRESASILLKNLVETTADPGIQPYARALGFYADRLDETFG